MTSICVFTGTRADWWLLRPLCRLLRDHPAFDLKILASGSHLSKMHGYTLHDISAEFSDVIPIDIGVSEVNDPAAHLARGVIEYSRVLKTLKPNFALVLGDRYEALGFAQATLLERVALIHCHGGESTLGAMDDQIRHAITKLAHVHFVSTETHRQRVLQMGENPDLVFNVGALGLDNIATLLDINKAFDPFDGQPFCVATFHPETLEADFGLNMVSVCLDSLKAHEIRTLITGTNADTGGLEMRALIESTVDNHPHLFRFEESLGAERYVSTMAISQFVIGNSSSGVIEAPTVGVPTINLGRRQLGRPSGPATIHIEDVHPNDLSAAFEQCRDPEFKQLAQKKMSPYGEPGAATRVLSHLVNLPDDLSRAKPFWVVNPPVSESRQ